MNRSLIALALTVVMGGRLAGLCGADDLPKSNSRPNIVLMLIDDLGWMDLSCQGSKYFETPHIDRLAQQGMRFTDAYAACAVCSPTRAAIQTGRYPARIGITDWILASFQGGAVPAGGTKLPDYVETRDQKLLCPRNPLYMELSEWTLAEALHQAGYVSCHVGKWHLGPGEWFPEKQGYAFNLGGCDLGEPPSYFDPYRSKTPDCQIPNLPPRRKGEYLTDRLADEACQFLRTHKDRPFFLNLCHYAVHTPLMGKKELIDKFEAKTKTNQKNAVYAAMIQSVDEATGRIMALLDDLNLADKTIVIFTSDNGGLMASTSNSPLRAGKGYPYEGGLRVPLIVRWPKIVQPGSLCPVPVCSIDLFPTFLEIAGVPLRKDHVIDGVSLMPVLTQTAPLKRDALYWHFPHYRYEEVTPYSIVRSGDWKLIRYYEDGRRELFNLADDLGETRDLADAMPEKVEQLDQQITTWLTAVGARLPIARNSKTH